MTETFDKSWWPRARCRGDEILDFFPNKDAADRIRELKEFCRPCPVRLECLQGAMDRNEEWGVWAGFEAREIRRLVISRISAAQALARKAA